MTILSIKRVVISLGEISINAYRVKTRIEGKEKTIDVLAGRSVTGAIDQHASSLLRSMGVKSLKDLPNLDLTLTQTGDLKADTGESFVPISIKDAAVYWGKMSQAKNDKATALLVASAVESIEKRIDAALEAEKKPEIKQKIETEIDSLNVSFSENMAYWVQKRAYSMSMHPWFQQHCIANRYPAWEVHDYMTTLIFGETAEQARQKPIVLEHLDPTIGLNHQEDGNRQEILAKVKRKFCLLQKGTWEEKVQRAVRAVMA